MVRPGFPIPEDEVESGSGRRGWVHATFYGDSMTEVGKKRQDYIDQYPPQGYDTHTEGPISRHPDGYYMVRVKRWSTCD